MDEIAVVTGAGGGIGSAVALMIHEKSEGGLKLALCDQRQGISELSGRIGVLQWSRTSRPGRTQGLDAVWPRARPRSWSTTRTRPAHEPCLAILESSYDTLLNLNLKAPAFLMRAFCKEMMAAGGGAVVNISSVLAKHALTGSALYRVSKAGLEALTKQFAAEFGPRGVRVNAVAPGFIMTPMTAGIPDETKEKIRSMIALGEFGTPEAVAEAVWHLVENQYINGVVLPVDGGMVL